MLGAIPVSKNVVWSAFLPRSRSKIVFVSVAACYAFTAGVVAQAIATAFGVFYAPSDPFASGSLAFHVADNLLFAPVLESLVLTATIELLRWLRLPASLQLATSAAVCASLHAFVSLALAFVVVPAWLIMSAAYLIWRRTSWMTGFIVVASVHALVNFLSLIENLSHVLRGT